MSILDPSDMVFTSGLYRLWVRDATLTRLSLISTFDTLTAKLVHNDVGSWIVEVPFESDAARDLMTPGNGVILSHRAIDDPVFSGPALGFVRSYAADDDVLVAHGVTDEAWFMWRVAHPQPASTAPPYNTNASRIVTDDAASAIETVINEQMGPGAIARRQIPTLTISQLAPTNLTTVTIEGRWQTVLEAIQPVANRYGLRLRIKQVGAALTAIIDESADLTDSVRFSAESASMESYEYGLDAPVADYVYLGGPGTGTARTIVEDHDNTARDRWGGTYRELFSNAISTSNSFALTSQLAIVLHDNGESVEVKLEPTGVGSPQFPFDWNLGDIVGVNVDGNAISELVRTVDLTIDKAGAVAKPDISGTQQSTTLDDHNQWVARELRNLARKVQTQGRQ